MKQRPWMVVCALVCALVGCTEVVRPDPTPAATVAQPGPREVARAMTLGPAVTQGALARAQESSQRAWERAWSPLAPREAEAISSWEQASARLGPQRQDWPTGAPLELDPVTRRSLERVYTEPGDLPRLQVSQDGVALDLPLRHTHVGAEISGQVARVEVRQTYRNPFTFPIETTYIFPLPENSAVDDMRMVIGEREVVARIERRAEARQVYEEARRAGQTAALLEQERPNVFTQSVANIAPQSEIEVVVRYVQHLTVDGAEAEFVFPMVVGPRFMPGAPLPGAGQGMGSALDTTEVPDASRISPPVLGGGVRSGHDVSLEVVAHTGVRLRSWEVPTHQVVVTRDDAQGFGLSLARKDELPNRDFVLRFRVGEQAPAAAVLTHREGGGEGTFALTIQPPALDLDALVGAREIIFVVDVSGSMSGTPLIMCQEAMRHALGMLRPMDTFNVMTFANGTARLFERPRPANDTSIRLAIEGINRLQAGGGTQLLDAVSEALRPPLDAERHRYVFFLTDGYVGNEAQIAGAAGRFVAETSNGQRRARVFSFGVGSSPNRHLLESLATSGDGLAFYASNREDPARGVQQFFRVIDHPVMTDLKIRWEGLAVRELTPKATPDLLASRAVVVHGRYARPGKGRAVIQGSVGGRTVTFPVEVELPAASKDNGAIETLWARARIAELERRLQDGIDKKIVEQITRLGLEHHIVTAYTSLVAVDRSRVVGNGAPRHIVQPVETPEGVDPHAAGAKVIGGSNAGCIGCTRARGFGDKPEPASGGSYGRGAGVGGGGVAYGSAGVGRGSGSFGAAPSPRLSSRSVTVNGSLDRDSVRRHIRRVQPRMKACYERALQGSPGLETRLTLELVIDAQGKVIKATVVKSSTHSEVLEACVVGVARALRFPAPGGGSNFTVRYPLIFQTPKATDAK